MQFLFLFAFCFVFFCCFVCLFFVFFRLRLLHTPNKNTWISPLNLRPLLLRWFRPAPFAFSPLPLSPFLRLRLYLIFYQFWLTLFIVDDDDKNTDDDDDNDGGKRLWSWRYHCACCFLSNASSVPV